MNGSFNKVIIIKNKVLKIENVVNSYSQNILNSLDSNHKTYYEDLKKIDIDVAKLYLDKKIFGKNIEIQEYIPGKTLASYMEDNNVSIGDKLDCYKKLLIIYKKTLSSDVALDLNMKNFVMAGDRLIYIDMIPSIYKSKIPKDNIESDEYKNYYLNSNLAIANVSNYFLRSIIYLPKENLKEVLIKMKTIVNEIFDFELDLSKNKKSNLMNNYIESNMQYEDYEKTYQKIKRM